ncbi:GNAT family N-acetyltransferase [Swingsia samuiensis]|uniref:N-acetyltransferase n=1 Tax=Swingsia samuiensis TaxID=1293412 RepID=A0A4Y6ULD8_9PROT|nr:GNAT family N-acetyltransferase [Swingsia samuiensis]QDH16845.1 N-acetyltransferase [Swingsia samuiensis]
MQDKEKWVVTLHSSIHDIGISAWDACAGSDNPFVSFGFLSALEDSGSVSQQNGWLVRHIALRNEDGPILAVAPLYGKLHSWGEYVFDHSWAQAYEAAGGRYYPKFQCAVPFSPVPGPRLLVRPDVENKEEIAVALATGMVRAAEELSLSSVHATFCDDFSLKSFEKAGYLKRVGVQYHWYNEGYQSFDDFLNNLSSRKRKNIRKERKIAHEHGLTFVVKQGHEITARDWAYFYKFYLGTVDKKWGSAYLTQDFFLLMAERLGNKVVLMLAEQEGEPVAGALNLMGEDTLFGRNWGSVGEWPFLHFELCYYSAIDFAIANNLSKVEAGAQGEHKIQRGYLPSYTYSAHAIIDAQLRKAVKAFLEQEAELIKQEAQVLAEYSPYRSNKEESL